MKNLLTLAILLSGLLIALPATANAETWYVDNNGDCGENTLCYSQIQDAIDDAIADDTVYVYEGTYNEDITLKSGVIVQGAGAEVTTIHGTGSASVVTATDVDSSAKIDGFTITGGSGSGGGISLTNSSPTISNNIITNNYSTYMGGGISISFYGSNPLIINNIISDNTALWHGGGIGLYQGFAKIVNNIIFNNTTLGYNGDYVGYGGGIGIVTYSIVYITNNTVVNNIATQQGGGGVGNSNSWVTLTNNIITSNTNGGVRHDGITTTIDYNDVWDNSEYQYLNCSAGAHDISQNPLFVDIGNYHLQVSSPCIDAGTNDVPDLPDTDFDGNPRVVDGNGDEVAVVDMGAFEYNHPPVAKCQIVTVIADSNCKGIASIDNGSYDPDLNPITITQSPASPYSLGSTMVTLTVTDSFGASNSCTGRVTVVDATPPSIGSITASPNVLWPPNHKMVPVTVNVSVSDKCNAMPICKITSISSNEPEDGLGDGNTAPDWEVTGDLTVNLRAECSGTGSGRVYTITTTCIDASGNISTGTVSVAVPYGQGKK